MLPSVHSRIEWAASLALRTIKSSEKAFLSDGAPNSCWIQPVFSLWTWQCRQPLDSYSRIPAQMSLKPVLMSWSGGKDSCLALYEIQQAAHYRVLALLTTLTRDYDRISMHAVRRVLLERQAASLGLPLHQVLITKGATNEEYESKMAEAFSVYRE